jgi:competence protein ComEA
MVVYDCDKMDYFVGWIKDNKFQAALLSLGTVLMGIGSWEWLMAQSRGDEVEIVESAQSEYQASDTRPAVVVDVGGAVRAPGVYNLEADARVGQAVEKAGGFTEMADAVWIAKMVNLAEVVKDGQKIFIPERTSSGTLTLDQTDANRPVIADSNNVNVNTASAGSLESLWGIGETRAQSIIANRPYSSLGDLKEKAGIPENVLEKNKAKITFY